MKTPLLLGLLLLACETSQPSDREVDVSAGAPAPQGAAARSRGEPGAGASAQRDADASASPQEDVDPSVAAEEEGAGAAEPERENWTQAELEAMSAEIQVELEELRGERFARPVAVRLAATDDLLEYMRARMAKTETPEKIAADETIAKLLAGIPADMDMMAAVFELIETQVGGFYDPDTDSFSLMDKCSKDVAPIILAHELDHALDDQLFGIDQRLLPIAHLTDRATAFQAVVEGSGMSVMTQWQMKYGGALDAAAAAEMQAEAQAGLADAPMWMWKPLLGVYMRGATFLARTDNLITGMTKAVPSADIRRCFEEPPLSTEQVLHPDKYWNERDDPVPVAVDTQGLPEEWAVLREDVLGELMLATIATPGAATAGLDLENPMAALAIEYTNDVAGGWGGDALVLVGSEAGRFLRLATAWDSVRDAGEFYGGMQAVLPAMRAAAQALSDKDRNAGAELGYGEREDVVVLTVWHSVDRRDWRALDEALAVSVP
jgi:hypothetical protein